MEYPEENALNIYTDGSMLSGPRRGGAAILFVLVDDHGNEERREEVLTGYSVTSKDSPYHGRASAIYSELHALRRREYRVRVNDETANPRIVENLGEVIATDDTA